jgi:adenine-specific DNA methylase
MENLTGPIFANEFRHRAICNKKRLARAGQFNTVLLRCNAKAYLGIAANSPASWPFDATGYLLD